MNGNTILASTASSQTQTQTQTQTNSEAFIHARSVIAGGVNSPVRSFASIGIDPPFISRGSGIHIEDIEGNTYIDFCASWGALLFGHADKISNAAVLAQVERGSSYGTPTTAESRLAALVCDLVPSVERLRMVSSGTEALMSALRLARGVTRRDLVVKFDGCYHGHSDSFLVNAGSGTAELSRASSQGIPGEISKLSRSIPYNNIAAVEKLMAEEGHGVAAIVVEPVAANMGLIPGNSDFLKALRRLCDSYGSLLIFDEVISGFRVSAGGAQQMYGLCADITAFGKIIGGGYPAAAFGASAELMSQLAPQGGVYQAGTLSGNPIAVAAGISVLERIYALGEDFYTDLNILTKRLVDSISPALHNIGFSCRRLGSMYSIFSRTTPPENFEQTGECNTEAFSRLYTMLMAEGVYCSPSVYETNFVSAAFNTQSIEQAIEKIIRAAENYSLKYGGELRSTGEER